MFFQLAEVLPIAPTRTWDLAKQLGVTHAVASVPVDEAGRPTADFLTLLRQKERFRNAGLDLVVLETAFPWAQHAKYGGPNAESEIETCCELIRNMGKVGIPVACWNWMAVFNWMRTGLTIPTRGGALVTGYDHALMANAPLTEIGEVSEATLWKNLRTFMAAITPVAEEAGVKLALHPDDPPISPIRGVGRILTSPDAMARAIDLVPSSVNGLTFCQGSFSTMNADIPAEIKRFGKRGAIHFVHFRDVDGTPARFQETFHDAGQTDMWAAMGAYHRVGFAGPMRPDHVPTMAGEENGDPGYEVLGRLFAIGYIKGLAEGVEKSQHHVRQQSSSSERVSSHPEQAQPSSKNLTSEDAVSSRSDGRRFCLTTKAPPPQPSPFAKGEGEVGNLHLAKGAGTDHWPRAKCM